MVSKSIDIILPYNFKLRHYQEPIFQAFFVRGIKKFCIIWHRRAGKDKTCLNLMIAAAALKKGMYIYVFPQLAQARRVIWNGIDSDGNRFLDHFPPRLIKSINNINMSIQLTNGSMFQLLGSDRYDRLRGLNFEGVILSEAQQHHPEAWNVLEPIHKENKNSWVLFEGTPNGRDNFLYESYAYGKTRDDWFTDLRTVDHTFREDGSWVISPEDIEELRQKGTLEAIIQQEYYCSFNAPNIGSYYGDLMEKADNEDRVLDFEIDLSLPVYTAWDLGMRDSTAIWLFQYLNGQIKLIHYYENNGHGIKHYIDWLEVFATNNKIRFGEHFAPHDIAVRELGSGRSRIEVARGYGLNFRIAPKLPVIDGINAVRTLFSQMFFHKTNCKLGIKFLRSYHKAYDDRLKRFNDRPCHDYSSDCADAMRYLCCAWQSFYDKPQKASVRVLNSFTP